MSATITLTGITWNHTRGFLPLIATAQRFGELHPDVTIEWHKRSLQEFADAPIERLAERFDLLIIDHPFAGYAAAHPTLLALDELLPADFLADQAANSVGASHASYAYGGHQWALAIDAATPVSAYRPDLLERYDTRSPETWDDLLALARRGRIALPAIPIDSLMNFYMLCIGVGEQPFASAERVVDPKTGVTALELLRELVSLCAPACLQRNPIATYEALVGDDLVYCPFAYGYSNYARSEYTTRPLRFGGLVRLDGRPLRSTLGGTGLAISARCRDLQPALVYAQFVASPACQRGMYAIGGGQPGHRQAWLDPALNQACNNYFLDTLPTLDDAYLRPRYPGYIEFQDHAGPVVHRYLREGGDPRAALAEIDGLYRQSTTR
ncbi:MAG TPA: extracellular solute-binding protein [Roseiflexaceae bacterium]|nr:extracellular solute-binding protein [Roseiflexaceae bacterium]